MTPALKAMVEAMEAELQKADLSAFRILSGEAAEAAGHPSGAIYIEGVIDLEAALRAALKPLIANHVIASDLGIVARKTVKGLDVAYDKGGMMAVQDTWYAGITVAMIDAILGAPAKDPPTEGPPGA